MRFQKLTYLVVPMVVIAVTICGATAWADASGMLKGKVVNFDGKGLKKVSVELTSSDDPSIKIKVKTDKEGLFEIEVEDASLSYDAQFDVRNYVGMSTDVTITAGETTERTFTMLTQQEVAEGKAEILRERELPKADPAMDLYNEGVSAFTAGDLVTARKRFEGALEHDDSMVQALSALCLITMQKKKWSEAAAYAERTLAIEPTDLRALFAAYRANKALGNEELAQEALEGLKSTGSIADVAGQTFNEGVDAYRARKAKDAITLFEQAVELDPTLADAHLVLAGLYLNDRHFEDSFAASDNVLALDPGNKKALTYRFEACLRSDCPTLDADMSELAAVDPGYVSKTMNERAFDLFEKNRYDDSKKLVQQLLVLDPDDARANYVLGLILVNGGDTATARKYLQKFIDAAPDDPDAAGARAMIEAVQ